MPRKNKSKGLCRFIKKNWIGGTVLSSIYILLTFLFLTALKYYSNVMGFALWVLISPIIWINWLTQNPSTMLIVIIGTILSSVIYFFVGALIQSLIRKVFK